MGTLRQSMTVTRLRQGEQGPAGRTSCPVRMRLWDSLAAGTVLTTGRDEGDEWTDVVVRMERIQIINPSTGVNRWTNRPTCYRCVARCTVVENTWPNNAQYSGYLQLASSYQMIATGVLLAENAVINLLQGNKVLVGGGKVGMQTEQYSQVRIWAGDTDPGIAPFRVLEDGSIYANKGVFAGSVVQVMKHIADSDAVYDEKNKTYRLNEDLNVICGGACKVILPRDAKYIGHTVRIANNVTVFTRSGDPSTSVSVEDDGVLYAFPENLSDLPTSGVYDRKYARFACGILELLALPPEGLTESEAEFCNWFITSLSAYYVS